MMQSSYYRYSHHARRALTHAEYLAQQFQHPMQDTGHLLVGVLQTSGSLGAQVFEELDLPIPVAEVYLKRLMDAQTDAPISPPFTPALAKAIEQAEDEAGWLDHHYVGTEHMLLGITRTNLGNAIELLRLVGISPEVLRRRVRMLISDGRTEFSLESLRATSRLSELSRRVLNAAEQIALDYDHPRIGTRHVLLALLRERRGVTSPILRQSGLSEEKLAATLAWRGTGMIADLEVILNTASAEAARFGSHYLGADHLLLAMTYDPVASSLMARCDASVEKVRRLLVKHLQRD